MASIYLGVQIPTRTLLLMLVEGQYKLPWWVGFLRQSYLYRNKLVGFVSTWV
jgi:hypothetical protein